MANSATIHSVIESCLASPFSSTVGLLISIFEQSSHKRVEFQVLSLKSVVTLRRRSENFNPQGGTFETFFSLAGRPAR